MMVTAQVNILPKNIFSVSDIRKKLRKFNWYQDKIKFVRWSMINTSHQVIGEEIPIQQTAAITELRTLKFFT